MTEEDKKRISEYMGWKFSEWRMIDGSAHVVNPHFFDLNDAGLCVEKMREKGDWPDFYFYFVTLKVEPMERSIFEMFNARNFFSAMAAWLRERGEK